MRDRRIHRVARGQPDPPGRAPPAGVSRVRQRGVATLDGDRLVVRKKAGRVRALEESLARTSRRRAPAGSATPDGPRTGRRTTATPTPTSAATGGERRGRPQRRDREPRRAPAASWRPQGFAFRSQTDTEVIAHLIARELGDGDDLFGAVQRVLPRLEGTYGLAVVSPRCPGQVVGREAGQPAGRRAGRRRAPPRQRPLGDRAPHGAGRVPPGRRGRPPDPRDFEIRHRERGSITPRIDRIDWKPDAVELGGHAHYMLKEIREQPDTVRDACRGRLRRREGDGRSSAA